MEYTPRKQSFLNSTVPNTSISPFEPSLEQRKKRFQRSSSKSNSKQKSDSKPITVLQTTNFFVKNVCEDILSKKTENVELLGKISSSFQVQNNRTKRQPTPAKQRRQSQKQLQSQEKFEQSLENELNLLKMERQLKEVTAQKQRFQAQNKALQQKITFLSLELAETINQNKFLQQKIKYLSQHEGGAKEGKNSSVSRIKKLIIDKKEQEKPDLDNLEQRMRAILYQNNLLKENMKLAENNYKQLQSNFQLLANERQLFLEDLVQQLKIQHTQKENTIKKLMIQLNIFLVRQSKRDKKGEVEKVEQLENIKKKYIKILKKYHQVSQQLAAYKRKSERMACLFRESHFSQTRSNSLDSLSFSP